MLDAKIVPLYKNKGSTGIVTITSVENKSASLLVASLGNALNGIPPSLSGKQVMGAKQSTRCGGPV